MDYRDSDRVQAFFMDALRDIGYPVSQPPGDASAQTWVTFNPVRSAAYMAGDSITRFRQLVQLHAWTRAETDEHRTAFFAALDALKAAGVRVYAWGPDDYEQDTGIHHIAATVTWWQAD